MPKQINGELQSRRDLSFQNPARKISPPYKSRSEFKGENMKNMFTFYDDFVAKMSGECEFLTIKFVLGSGCKTKLIGFLNNTRGSTRSRFLLSPATGPSFDD